MNQSIVSNTGPLIALATAGCLDVLNSLFGEVFVPEAVNEEVLCGGAGVLAYKEAKWIKVVRLQTAPDVLLQSILDAGEAAVIQTAREQRADMVLIDELKGRKLARTVYGLKVAGTARILVEAKRAGILANVQDPLQRMREHGYWIHQSIVDVLLREAGEM